MAELATAGSLVGLISLSIQSCQGLTSYYSVWKAYDEQIGHTHRSLDELRITCENLERELQRITQYQEPPVQQVVRLIASCQEGINNLRHALQQCRSVQIPDSLTAKVKLYRDRALYPFKKQTLQRLKDTVHDIQGNLSSALQILQLHVSTEQEQKLAVLVKTTSGIETAVRNNQTAIQALSLPLQAMNQAHPLIKRQNDATAIALRAVREEAHDFRQEARNFRQKALTELTKLADRVDSSPGSLERSIVTTLNRHGAGMGQLRNELQYAHSQDTNQIFAKLEAIDQSIKSLQIGLISNPSLMRSVCEENDSLRNLPGLSYEWGQDSLISGYRRRKRYQRCSCKPQHNSAYAMISSESSCYSGTTSIPKWMFIFKTESMSHHLGCHLFVRSCSTTVAKICIKRCGAFLSGAIEASIAITRGAGGFSISPGLQCARVVPASNPAFELVDRISNRIRETDIGGLQLALEAGIQDLARLYRDGKASPYDVDLEGDTLLHKASTLLGIILRYVGEAKRFHELIVWFLKGLEELCVPLNSLNDHNLTFMNVVVSSTRMIFGRGDVLAPFTRLLDTGAEFAMFWSPQNDAYNWSPMHLWMVIFSAGFVDCLEDNELSIAIWHRSERELDKVLRESPQLINQINGLANTSLHLAVGWPYGIRVLLQHGACVNATDEKGWTPLYYAIHMGFTETVRILMKADCSINVDGLHGDSVLRLVIQVFRPTTTRTDVLDTFILSLIERRHNLQSRLAALSAAVTINPKVFQADRVLDEYAQYAECVEKDAIRGGGHMPRHASSLLRDCRTVYHVRNLTLEIAEKLWQNGFRDIDVPNEEGRTPLMRIQNCDMHDRIEVSSWFFQKGAKLHRLQHESLGYDADPTSIAMGLASGIRALHYVAYNIGKSARELVWRELWAPEKRWLQIEHHRLSKEARLLATNVLLDVSCDGCICACSSQGCLASTMMLKSFREWSDIAEDRRKWFLLATDSLIDLEGPNDPCPDWLTKGIIRYQTFEELELRHTCCYRVYPLGFTRRDPEEQAEIRDEDHEKIELLESLLQEFEDHRGAQDVLSFLKGYWVMRMDQVHRERSHVDKEALREIGVVLDEEDWEGSDEEGSDEEGSDGEGSDGEGSHGKLGDDAE